MGVDMVSLRDQTIAQLRDEIAALKAERDEARADLEELRVQKDTIADIWTQQQIRDADEIHTLVMEVERLKAELAAQDTD